LTNLPNRECSICGCYSRCSRCCDCCTFDKDCRS